MFHATFYDPAALRLARGAKLVVTVLDMIPEHFPEYFAAHGLYGRFVTRRWIAGKRRLCERASVILAISEHTKRDLVAHYGLDPARIVVTHLGNRLSGGAEAAAPFPGRYVLFVGTRNTYKNFGVVLDAPRALPPYLARVRRRWPFDAASKPTSTGSAWARVVQRSVRDDGSPRYAHALAFVFPSLRGLRHPDPRTFACDCPRCSRTPAVSRDAAVPPLHRSRRRERPATALRGVIANPEPWREARPRRCVHVEATAARTAAAYRRCA